MKKTKKKLWKPMQTKTMQMEKEKEKRQRQDIREEKPKTKKPKSNHPTSQQKLIWQHNNIITYIQFIQSKTIYVHTQYVYSMLFKSTLWGHLSKMSKVMFSY